MMRLFSPRKTTILFVIRDKTKVRIHVFVIRLYAHFALWIMISLLSLNVCPVDTVLADSTWIFRAHSKRRYSEGKFVCFWLHLHFFILLFVVVSFSILIGVYSCRYGMQFLNPKPLKILRLMNFLMWDFFFVSFSFYECFVLYKHFTFHSVKVYWHFLLLTWRWRLLLYLAMKKKKSNLKSR